MVYTLENPNPSDDTLRVYGTLNHPLGERALEPVQQAIQKGEVSLRDLWLLSSDDGTAYAALRLQPYPGQPGWRLGTLRTAPDIPDDAASTLFTRLRELSDLEKPSHIVYSDKVARDFGTLPARYSWHGGDDYSVSHRTDLGKRDDLGADPAAQMLELDELLGEAFRNFYKPIWTMKRNPSDERSFKEVMQNLHAFAKNDEGQLYTLNDGGMPVAMGIVTSFAVPGEHAAGCNMLGVLPEKRQQGWGKRLHRHLMWAAKARSPLYLGSTDASNTAMLRLFEVNGCIPNRKDWELEPA